MIALIGLQKSMEELWGSKTEWVSRVGDTFETLRVLRIYRLVRNISDEFLKVRTAHLSLKKLRDTRWGLSKLIYLLKNHGILPY